MLLISFYLNTIFIMVPLLHEIIHEIGLPLNAIRNPVNLSVLGFPKHYDPTILFLLNAGAIAPLIVSLLLIIRGMKSHIIGTKQPAFFQYFFKEAFTDLRTVTTQTSVNTVNFVVLELSAIVWITMDGPQFFLLWPISLTVLIAMIPAVLSSIACMVLLLFLHSLALLLIVAIIYALSLTIATVDHVIIFIRSGYAKCPHAGCHRPIPLPVFHCPECKTKHDHLYPGRYGIFHRSCQCGKAKLQTLFWTGKGKLVSSCPFCKKFLHEELFGKNMHIPIYGGTSAGKTMLMMSITWALLEGKLNDVSAYLIDESAKKTYQKQWKVDFENGREMEKTKEMLPDAFLISMKRRNGLPNSLYLYDPAGEANIQEEFLEGHRFLKFIDGIALVIDPFSLNTFSKFLSDSADIDPYSRPSLVAPDEIVHHIVNVLESQAGLSRRESNKIRLAVIITKTDYDIVRETMGIDTEGFDEKTSHTDWNDSHIEESRKTRLWFEQNEPALIQLIETRFKNVRFFCVSSMGHSLAKKAAFTPRKVLDPMCWLLSNSLSFSRPDLFQMGLKAVEVLAVVTILLILFSGSVYAIASIANRFF